MEPCSITPSLHRLPLLGLSAAGLGDLIRADRLTPQRIAFVFRASASNTARRDLAVIILAAAHARFRIDPYDWDACVERQLALDALAGELDPEATLQKLGKDASRILPQSPPTPVATQLLAQFSPLP